MLIFAEGAVIRAYESMQKTTHKCGLSSPERLTSMSMRKYAANLTQVLNLSVRSTLKSKGREKNTLQIIILIGMIM